MTETACGSSSGYDRLSDAEKEIVKLSEGYSDKKLMKLYSRERNETDFLNKVSQQTIERFIRPLVEKRHKAILQLVETTGTPLFRRDNVRERDFQKRQVIERLIHPSKMVFFFRHSDRFTYTVRVQNEGLSVDLFGAFFAPLCARPAHAVIGDRLHFFEDVDEKKLRPFFAKQQIEVPQRYVAEYIRKFVLQCVKNYDVVAEGIKVKEKKYRPVAALTLESDFDLRPVLNLKFRYGEHSFAIDRPYRKEVTLLEQEGSYIIEWFYRDEAWERGQMEMLISHGLIQTRTGQFVVPDGALSVEAENPFGVLEWLNRNAALLSRFELKQSLGEQLYYTGEIGVRLSEGEMKPDWFDLRCTVCFGAVEIPFVRLKNHILNRIRTYVLPDNRIAVLPSEWFVRFGELFRLGTIVGDAVRLKKYHFRVKELAENGFVTAEKVETRALLLSAPKALQASLRPYQTTGFRWLAYLQRNGFGGCLADDMGLGKTLQTIALLLYVYSNTGDKVPQKSHQPRQLSLFDEIDAIGEGNESVSLRNDLPPTLIVMPTSLVHNWLNEFRKFAPQLKVSLHAGANRLREEAFLQQTQLYHIMLTSYGTVRQDIDFLQQCHFHYIVLDESQYIKNPSSQIFQCVKHLKSRYKLSLTGTPIENSITDLWAQMDFVNDQMLGTVAAFEKRFQANDLLENERVKTSLLNIVSPFILRRTKEEVAPELPPLTEEIRYCEMSQAQALLYNEEKNRVRNMLLKQRSEEYQIERFALLSSLTRLRLMANHPALVTPDFSGLSGKFEQVIADLETIFAVGHKVLIFSSFVKHLRLFADYFAARQWPYARLTGSTVDREAEIDRFSNDENVRTFFISLRAGGTGLNLTAADYVFILDPWWNPAAEMQAVSRAHRIGQGKSVTLYRFISQDSVEEKILQLQQQKSALSDALIPGRLSGKELEELLSNKQ